MRTRQHDMHICSAGVRVVLGALGTEQGQRETLTSPLWLGM